MAPKPRFVEGEKVICFQSPLLYEGKCLKSRTKDKESKEYLIHYNGWNKNWDEWVPQSRVFKYNLSNLEKMKELVKTHVKTKKKVGVTKKAEKELVQTTSSEKPKLRPKTEKRVSLSSSSTEQSTENQPEHKKKKVRFAEPCFREEVKKVEIKLDFPDFLKEWLLDDQDLITRQKKILSLPARVTVDHVIAGFVKEKVSVKGISQLIEKTILQFANVIKDCFNVLLGNTLLFEYERPQYAENHSANSCLIRKVAWSIFRWSTSYRPNSISLYCFFILSLPDIRRYLSSPPFPNSQPLQTSRSVQGHVQVERPPFRRAPAPFILLPSHYSPIGAKIYVHYCESGMSQVYGAIHLLRMIPKLGDLVTPIVGTKYPSSLVEHLNDFVN